MFTFLLLLFYTNRTVRALKTEKPIHCFFVLFFKDGLNASVHKISHKILSLNFFDNVREHLYLGMLKGLLRGFFLFLGYV